MDLAQKTDENKLQVIFSTDMRPMIGKKSAFPIK